MAEQEGKTIHSVAKAIRLLDLLTQAGKDTDLADQVEETYQAEKSMKKAYYIQKFQEG